MLVAEEPPGPAQPCLHLVADEQRAVIVHELAGSAQEPVRRDIDAFALNRFDDERCYVALPELGFERI